MNPQGSFPTPEGTCLLCDRGTFDHHPRCPVTRWKQERGNDLDLDDDALAKKLLAEWRALPGSRP